MINNEIIKYLQNYSNNLLLLNKLLVGAYIAHNHIDLSKNKLLLFYCQGNDKKEIENFNNLLKTSDLKFEFEDLIQLFEVTIPENDIVGNGAVYTPELIKDFIISGTIEKLQNSQLNTASFADISCGAGAFLFKIAEKIYKETKKSFLDIFTQNIFGLDISEYSVERTKILLALLALSHGEDEEEFHFNIFTGNALDFDWKNSCEDFPKLGFDAVVGNPPYVRAKNITKETKKLLKNWEVTKTGNPDLYIPFFEIAIKCLKPKGILGYITVNTFKRSVNARSLRHFFSKNKLDISILDFGSEQVFDKKSTYTCIVFISNSKNTDVKYKKISIAELKNKQQKEYYHLSYQTLDNDRGWLLNNPKILENINKIENAGFSLGEKYKIRNGLATLSNDLFIFKPVNEDENYYYLQNCTRQYKIEKNICKDVIKPNRLKSETEISNLQEKIIFPYNSNTDQLSFFDTNTTKLEVFEEDYFKNSYPNAYEYLEINKEQLLNRDKGKKVKYKWYEFGRSQAIKDSGKKLLFPYMSNQPYFVYTNNADLLFYAGYAIFSENDKELFLLKKILQSKVFWYYIENTSKPYAGNFFALAKNYVKDFSICPLNEKEEKFLLETDNKIEIDNFLSSKYELNIK